ncbi:MAG: hypothetical protein CR964_00115 [Rhodobacterales bacterium]|nr:MAG: hypothetical protein CR964_00115 [Rhodobacterales bacterium]
MTDIILGVDGSGPVFNYAEEFKESHVKRLCGGNRAGFWDSFYLRGPSMAGMVTKSLSNIVTSAAVTYYGAIKVATTFSKEKKPPRLFLAGYSRGGAAVIDAAYDLKSKGIPVRALLLFDAVDRTHTISSRVDVIPENVEYCFHAMRDPATESRSYFGNCGTSSRGSTIFVTEHFACTHGAMGGTPNTEFSEDGFAMEDVGGSAGEAAAFIAGGVKKNIDDGIVSMVTSSAPKRTAGFVAGGVSGLNALHELSKTTVTKKKELSEQQKVWNWMQGNLLIAQRYVGVSGGGW